MVFCFVALSDNQWSCSAIMTMTGTSPPSGLPSRILPDVQQLWTLNRMFIIVIRIPFHDG